MPTVASLDVYSFAFNGFVFGGADSPYQITSVEGLEDLPVIRNQDDNRGYADGMFTGRDFLSGRTLIFTFQIFSDANYTMTENLAFMQTALQPQQSGTTVLQFQVPGQPLQRVNARARRRSIKIDPDFTYGKATGIYEFFCPDPLIYADAENNVNIYSVIPPSGRTYDRVYTAAASPGANPFDTGMSYGGGSSSNIITNGGWATTYPTITINGPAVNPRINDTSTGEFLLINYSMTNSDIIVLDCNLRSVTLNGNNQRSLLDNTSSWFNLPAGTTLLSFTAVSGTDANTSCVVSWRNAYI
jgi:hypothetical protein